MMRSWSQLLAQRPMMTSATQHSCGRLRIVGNRGSITVLRDRREEGMATITLLLQRVREGEQAARDSLFELAYDSLKGLARSRLRSDGRGEPTRYDGAGARGLPAVRQQR